MRRDATQCCHFFHSYNRWKLEILQQQRRRFDTVVQKRWNIYLVNRGSQKQRRKVHLVDRIDILTNHTVHYTLFKGVAYANNRMQFPTDSRKRSTSRQSTQKIKCFVCFGYRRRITIGFPVPPWTIDFSVACGTMAHQLSVSWGGVHRLYQRIQTPDRELIGNRGGKLWLLIKTMERPVLVVFRTSMVKLVDWPISCCTS